MLRFGLLMCVCLFFLGCALLFCFWVRGLTLFFSVKGMFIFLFKAAFGGKRSDAPPAWPVCQHGLAA